MGGCMCGNQNPRIMLAFTLHTNQIINLSILKTSIVRQLKQRVYHDHNNQLRPQLMVFMRNGRILNDNQQIFSQDSVRNSKQPIFIRKAQIWQLGLKGDREAIDPISLEKGVVELKCKHTISRGGFIGALQYQLNTLKKYEVQCPSLLSNGNICRQLIDRQNYQLFAGYTQNLWNVISVKLSQNYLLNNTTKCPGCGHSIQKGGLNVKRCICPLCGCMFCFQCSQLWIWEDDFCQSQRCFAINNLIANAPWDRIFMMHLAEDYDNTFPVMVPNLRACPACKTLLRNTEYCKHTQCTLCRLNFCFVCLKIKGSEWPCGGAFQYCGIVAPNQNVNLVADFPVGM